MNKKIIVLFMIGLFFIGLFPIIDNPIKANNPDDEAYIYEYIEVPEDVLGIESYWKKYVNWSYFKSLFLSAIEWGLFYKITNESSWVQNNQYMETDFTWIDSKWKITINFTAPINVYQAEFRMSINRSILGYTFHGNQLVSLNYQANNTEEYSVYYNWSDLAEISGLYWDKGINDNKFWFKFGRYNISAGFYSFDPTFGETTTNNAQDLLIGGNKNYIRGTSYTMGATAGEADNITVRFGDIDLFYDADVRCSIYERDGEDDAGDRICYSETINIQDASHDNQWVTFNISGSPSLSASTNYFLVVEGLECSGSLMYVDRYANIGGESINKQTACPYSNLTNSPLTGEYGTNVEYAIYCNYTEVASNNCPTFSSESPTNQSTGQALQPQVAITINDLDGDTMDLYWYNSTDGSSWVHQQKNASVGNGTYRWDYTEANEHNTQYYWKVAANDGEGCNATEINYFTTHTNACPTFSSESPTNATTGIATQPNVNLIVTDTDGDTLDCTFYTSTNGVDWTHRQVNNSISSGTRIYYSYTQASAWGTQYWWKVHADDGSPDSCNSSEINHFTTNILPTAASPVPTNNSNGIALQPQLRFTLDDNDDNPDVYWYTSINGVDYTYRQKNSSVIDGFVYYEFTQANNHNTDYWWKVALNDGIVNRTYWYKFTTHTNACPTFASPSPANQTIGLALQPNVNVIVNDADSDTLDCTFYTSTNGVDWTHRQVNNSIAAGTRIYYIYTQANTYTTQFWWRVTADDGSPDSCNSSVIYHFTTNVLPTAASPYPTNGSIDIPPQPTCYFTLADSDDDPNVYWYNSSDGITYYHQQINSSCADGIYRWDYTEASAWSTKYYWKIAINDGIVNRTYWYNFTTSAETNYCPYFNTINPANNSIGLALQPTVSLKVNDDNGDSTECDFYTSPDNIVWTWRQHNASVADGDIIYYNYIQANNWNTDYYWKVTANDSICNTTTIWYKFSTNDLPQASNPNPANNSVGIALQPTCEIDLTDSDDNPDIFWFTSLNGVDWTYRQQNLSCADGTYRYDFTTANSYATNYWWRVAINDSIVNRTFDYKFTTNVLPTASSPYPANDSSDISLHPTCSFNLADSDDNPNVYWYNSSDGITYYHQQINSSVADGNVYWHYTEANSWSTEYWWKIAINDGVVNRTYWYNFTTMAEPSVTYNFTCSLLINNTEDISIDIGIIKWVCISHNGSSMDLVLWCNGHQSTYNNVGNGTYNLIILSNFEYNKTYQVYCNVTDDVSVVHYFNGSFSTANVGGVDLSEVSFAPAVFGMAFVVIFFLASFWVDRKKVFWQPILLWINTPVSLALGVSLLGNVRFGVMWWIGLIFICFAIVMAIVGCYYALHWGREYEDTKN